MSIGGIGALRKSGDDDGGKFKLLTTCRTCSGRSSSLILTPAPSLSASPTLTFPAPCKPAGSATLRARRWVSSHRHRLRMRWARSERARRRVRRVSRRADSDFWRADSSRIVVLMRSIESCFNRVSAAYWELALERKDVKTRAVG